MFDIGFAEVFLLSIIGLLVLGPERLPAVARTLGGFVRKARLSYHNLKRTVEAELAAADATAPLKEAQQELESVKQQVSELTERLDEDQTRSPRALTPPDAPEEDAGTREALAGPSDDDGKGTGDGGDAPSADPADGAGRPGSEAKTP